MAYSPPVWRSYKKSFLLFLDANIIIPISEPYGSDTDDKNKDKIHKYLTYAMILGRRDLWIKEMSLFKIALLLAIAI